jgi:hypothetical protein
VNDGRPAVKLGLLGCDLAGAVGACVGLCDVYEFGVYRENSAQTARVRKQCAKSMYVSSATAQLKKPAW